MHRRAIETKPSQIWKRAIFATMLSIACNTVLAASSVNNVAGKNDSTGSPVDVNPHWDKTQCDACHVGEAKKGKPAVRADDDKSLCLRCHAEDVAHKYIHPAGIAIPKSFEKRMQKSWRGKIPLDKDKRLTCVTCHDLLNQCLAGRAYMKQLNPRFLREGPYANRTEVCYKCHDASKYKRMVAHDQIASDGTLKVNKCRLCHQVKDKRRLKSGIKRDLEKFPIINNLDTDRTLLCIRCHKKIDHPTSAFKVASLNTYRHFVRITDEKKRTLDSKKAATGIYMPLEPGTERIYCGTCHEAHQPGVFAGEVKKPAPETQNRLRVNQICTYCHDK